VPINEFGLSLASLLFFSFSLKRETWTQELLEVVKVLVDSTSSVPQRIITRCLRVYISILYNYLLFLDILILCMSGGGGN
jgi:hypothetical protein